MDAVTVVVPAHDEAGRIGATVDELAPAYDVVVVDDGSTDATAAEAREAGARVVELPENEGYLPALRRGFRTASGEVLVTCDGDGEHRPEDVQRLAEPVRDGRFDLVLGCRASVPRRTERLLDAVVRWRVGVSDAYTGFRALRRDLVDDLRLDSRANCGTLVLDAAAAGARIGEVEIETRRVRKPRGVAWDHARHFVRVLRTVAGR